jgi:AraC-like DNA-binding protein
MFEPFGGVARFIQAERLARAHAALSDPDDIRSIGRNAEDVGLFDLSSFGRMFRAGFGCSPPPPRVPEQAAAKEHRRELHQRRVGESPA